MTVWLKQSTSVSVVIGPVWDTSTGALKADLAYNASGINCDIYKNGTKADVTLANSAGDGYFRAASGEALYLLTISTGHTDTLGRLEISLSATGYYMKPEHLMVVPANVWDSMFGADYLKTEVVEISGDSTAADNLEADYDGTGYAKTNSTTKLHADYDAAKTAAAAGAAMTLTSAYDAAKTAASQSSVNTIDDFLDTEVAAILADTNELQTDLTNGGRLDLLIDAIKAKTDNLPADPADDSDIDAQLAAIAGYLDTEVAAILAAVDTEVAAIKAKTDNLPASPAAVGSQMDLVGAPNATAVTAIQSGLATAAALDAVDNFVDTEVGAIKAVTDKLDTALELDGAVYRYTTNALEQAPTGGSAPSAATIADAVWDEALSGHTTAGSAGKGLADAGSAGDPWSTALPGAYGAGTAGKIIGDNINAPIGTVDTVVDAIKAKTDNLPASPAAVGSQMDLVNAPNATALGAVADKLLGRAIAGGADVGRTVRQALRALRNKSAVSEGTLTVYQEDDTTSDWTAAVTTDAAAEPITGVDPA